MAGGRGSVILFLRESNQELHQEGHSWEDSKHLLSADTLCCWSFPTSLLCNPAQMVRQWTWESWKGFHISSNAKKKPTMTTTPTVSLRLSFSWLGLSAGGMRQSHSFVEVDGQGRILDHLGTSPWFRCSGTGPWKESRHNLGTEGMKQNSPVCFLQSCWPIILLMPCHTLLLSQQ